MSSSRLLGITTEDELRINWWENNLLQNKPVRKWLCGEERYSARRSVDLEKTSAGDELSLLAMMHSVGN